MAFPATRMRRLRRTAALRDMVRETRLSPENFVYPLFVCPGEGVRREVRSMPGVFNLSVDEAVREARETHALGIPAVILFGLPEKKDEVATGAWEENGIVQRAARAIKAEVPELLLTGDVCLCEYMSHGHCGIAKASHPPKSLGAAATRVNQFGQPLARAIRTTVQAWKCSECGEIMPLADDHSPVRCSNRKTCGRMFYADVVEREMQTGVTVHPRKEADRMDATQVKVAQASASQYEIVNDATLELLARTSVSLAKAGIDIIAPSDMMDGRVTVIRKALDENGFENTPILSYAAKFASAFYGPFREAADSAPQFGDRRSYQMDGANLREALREIALDVEEGADMIMVKPAMPYLDVIAAARERFDLPIAAYQVSGEYAMIEAAARNNWIDRDRVMLESLTSIRRAGASIILTYFAKDAAKMVG